MGTKKKREFLHWKEVKKTDGTIARWGVYKDGSTTIIIDDAGREHRLHPSASSIDLEINTYYGVEVVRTLHDS